MTHEEPTEQPNYALRKFLIATIGGLLILFLSAYALGYTMGTLEHHGFSMTDIVMLTSVVGLITFIAFICWKSWPVGDDELVSQSVKKSRQIMIGAVIFGVFLGIMLAVLGMDDATGIFTNAPVSPTMAFVAIALWLGVTPVMTWIWWRSVDEHEAKAYSDSSLVAVHFYLFLVPSWWMATRADLAPPQDPMIVLCIVSAVWLVVWVYRKYT